ncbi:MAG: RNA methyltransferase [Thermoplasmata archaeon]|nr:RNA methyltransferase [Thermoplasmata archaeon]
MHDITIILVEPKYAGNAGAVARLIKNFAFKHLWLISPKFSLEDDDCIKYSMHAYDVIENARIFDSFDDVIKEIDYLAGTTSVISNDDEHHLRKYMDVRDFAEMVNKIDGRIGIAFGREDYGLFNEEIMKCDILINIPTSSVYPTMNLSHSVAIVLYELFRAKGIEKPDIEPASKMEVEKLHETFSELLRSVSYPEYKRQHAEIIFRRIIGRAVISKWEYHNLMGVLKKAMRRK